MARFQQAIRAVSGGSLEFYGTVEEPGGSYPLLRCTLPGERWVTITSGFHGEEQAGPLTLLEHLGAIASHARERGVGLRIYPCVNPSGFEAGSRYNASGERPNNDFLRYELEEGVWAGELKPGESFARWAVFLDGPKESRHLIRDLERFSSPIAALDIHQDGYMAGRVTYAYVFGDRSRYVPLMAESGLHARVALDQLIDDAGFSTDARGFVEHHDGSVSDYFWRRGTPYVATLETTVDNSLSACHAINLIWVRGFVELAHRVLHDARGQG